jgi:hypothetical protein
MKESTKLSEGTRINRTGMGTSPYAEEMRQVPAMTRPSRPNGGLHQAHAQYLKETHAIGTVPPPTTVKGAAKVAAQALKGNKAIALVDKIGERLAFERTGVRFYDTVLDKLDASPGFKGGPSRQELEHIRGEELEHACMLQETLEALGADPTAVTPSADLAAIEGSGLGTVLGDPRTTVGQCLHALLVAELADKDGWTLLCDLSEALGQSELTKRFRAAEEEEGEHLTMVRSWVAAHAKAEAELI